MVFRAAALCLLSSVMVCAEPGDGPRIVFSHTFGGSGSTTPRAIARDAAGNIYIAGETNSADFPIRAGAQPRPGSAPLTASDDQGVSWIEKPLGASTVVYDVAAAPSLPSRLYAATDHGFWTSSDSGITWTTPSSFGINGIITTISVDAGSPSLIYSATADAVWLTADGGTSWQSTTLNRPRQPAPSQPAVGRIYAHPAIPGMAFVSYLGQLYRTTDSGKTWTPAGIRATAVAFLRSQPATGWACGYDGISQSTDTGATWNKLNSRESCQSMSTDPSDPSILYVLNASIRKSTDGGITFSTLLFAGALNAFASDPSASGSLYAAGPFALYHSADAGATWAKQFLPLESPAAMLLSQRRVFVTGAVTADAFISKWSPDGTQLLYSTYLGGSAVDLVSAIAVDPEGSAYILGATSSRDFPTTPGAFQPQLAGAQNAFLAKLSPDGSHFVYTTLLGGGTERAFGLAIDSTGSAFVTGTTSSSLFPLTPGTLRTTPGAICQISPWLHFVAGSAFVTRVAPDGQSLIFSTLLGGTRCETTGYGVAIAANGDAWVVGRTSATGESNPDDNFPTTPDALESKASPGDFDGFLTRFDPSGRLLYSTFLGGTYYDSITSIHLDADGNLYVAGTSAGFAQAASENAFLKRPVVPTCSLGSIAGTLYYPQGDFFVMKLDSSASRVTGLSYLGVGTCSDAPLPFAVDDSTGAIWIAGTGFYGPGPAIPTVAPLQMTGNAVLSRFSPDLTSLDFSTAWDVIGGVALDRDGEAYVTSYSYNPAGASPAAISKLHFSAPRISLNTVSVAGQNSYAAGAVAPGAMLRLTGSNLGPVDGTRADLSAGGYLPTSLAGVEVLVEGFAVPLLSVSAQEILCMAPFGIAGYSRTTLQVQVNGEVSNEVTGYGTPTAFSTLDVLNEDLTPNSESNPAAPGSTITAHITGAGQTNPPSQDGQIDPPAYALPAVPISVRYAGITSPPISLAPAAGQPAGILEIKFKAAASTMNVFIGTPGVPTEAYIRLFVR